MVVLLVKKALHPCLWIALSALVVMAAVFLVRNAGTVSRKQASAPSAGSTVPTVCRININTADMDALQQLPGIGPSTAAAILEYRQTNGPFTSPEQLLHIQGIGQKKLLSLLEYINWEE